MIFSLVLRQISIVGTCQDRLPETVLTSTPVCEFGQSEKMHAHVNPTFPYIKYIKFPRLYNTRACSRDVVSYQKYEELDFKQLP